MSALRLACVDVRDVDFHEGDGHAHERVAEGEAAVRIRAAVHDRSVDPPAHRVHGVDQLSLAVVLRALEVHAELLRDLSETALDILEGGATVAFRLTNAEQVEVGTVEEGDPHRCFSPCNQELNCSMSSSLRSAGSPAAGVSCEGRPPPDVLSPSTFCEKNWSNEKP